MSPVAPNGPAEKALRPLWTAGGRPNPPPPLAGRPTPAPDSSGPETTPHSGHAVIVSAALPLVVRHGTSVTTSMVARAAGVPTAAVFTAFPDKATLLEACAAAALRADEAVAALSAIDPTQPLETRLTSAAAHLRSYATRLLLLADAMPSRRPRLPGPTENIDEHARHEEELASLREALTALFAPERELLRIPPERLARVFLSMVLSDAPSGPAESLPTEELVSLLLWGSLAPP
ncbi:TetR/AcrR family transcriptional regulator [Streptomyces spororaveus]|uniref:TetR family transcriptional regulator n=1 Tax=Streptomyces spororaveus TaxID=284039 RepID=A0ABQ3TNA8_9ACTN|nr:TetR family transcriptional regulator [Streptomyces spororaveus]